MNFSPDISRIDVNDLKHQLRGRWDSIYTRELGEPEQRIGDHLVFYCPFHADKGSDKPNLWVKRETGEWYCHGSCKAGGDAFDFIKHRHNVGFRDALETIAGVYGLSIPAPSQNGGNHSQREPEHLYIYNDSDGQPYIGIGRYPGKKFVAFHFNDDGKRAKGLNERKPVLYRLDEVTRAVNDGREIIVVEGEKDVDRLASEGFVATTNPFGSGKWKHVEDDVLSGAHVAIIPDNDEVGHNHARNVAESLYGKAASVKVVELPLDGEGTDASDYLDAGHSADDLRALIKDAPEWEPPADELDEPREYRCTDLGNAERFADQHGDEVAYVEEWGWLAWDSKRWNPDNKQLVRKRASETARSIYQEASTQADPDKRSQLAKWAIKSESRAKLEAMTDLAKMFCVQRPEQFDADETDFLLNVENGTVDLTSGQLREHRKADRITKLAPVTYDPAANADEWRAFLDHIFAGDDELQRYLQKAIGYSLTASTREQCLFILWGSGANGKSTFVNTIMSILGDYTVQTATDTITQTRHEGIPNDVARLAGTRFVSAIESSEGRKLNESLVKQMTGGDRISARFLHREWFDFVAKFKLFLATNHKPRIDGNEHAIWRRVKLIPFTVQIPESAQDRDLAKRLLQSEASGILNWAIEGCQMWRSEGLDEPEAVRHATAEYRREQDVLADFIADKCVVKSDAQAKTKDLYSAYQRWADEYGEKPIKSRRFGQLLGERGFESIRTKSGRGWQGIGLATDEPLDLSEDADDS